MLRVSSFFVVALVFAAFACSAEPAAATSPTDGASEDEIRSADLPDVVVFEEHDESTVGAREGQNVVLRLPEPEGTQWVVEEERSTIGIPTRTSELGKVIFTWKTTNKVGRHFIELYAKDASGEVTAGFAFDLDVTARYTCPVEHTINCMPGAAHMVYCTPDYRRWIRDNRCDVQIVD
jgi:hypothetical protein